MLPLVGTACLVATMVAQSDGHGVTRPVVVVGSPTNDEATPPRLRAEAEHALLVNGDGRLTLEFNLDPLLDLHWAGGVEALRFELSAPDGMSVSPSSGSAPEGEVAADRAPREFLVDVSGWPLGAALELEAHYLVCDPTETCTPVTRTYAIHRKVDPDADVSDAERERVALHRREGRNGPTGMTRQLMELDVDGDGRLDRSEIPEAMEKLSDRFDQLDRNGDGFIDARELEEMTRIDFRRRR